MSQAGILTSLFRYPVKGLSPEPMARMPLRAGHGLENDRCYALALGTTAFDQAAPVPLAKFNFLMLARNECLATLDTSFDSASGTLRIARKDERLVEADLRTPAGREAVGAFFTAFAGDAARGRIHVVAAEGHRFTDIGAPVPAFMNCVSLINLTSLRSLEAAMGRPLDPMRFRANLYVDGLPAWAELDWIGQQVSIAGQPFRAVRRTRRCPATNVNPATAERDADVPKALMEHFGHPDLGIYLEVLVHTTLTAGDSIAGPA